jgi:para-nitrobenzyl esterase
MFKKFTSVIAVAGLLSVALFAQIQSRGPVKLDSGPVSGAITGQHNDISAYKGIPFAMPPVGNLRWRDPQPVKTWTDVRLSTEFSPIFPQRPSQQPQDEDALTINVWTPAKSSTDRLPVMFWIYGGGFTYGSSAGRIYDGTHVAEHGVVVVSFNYRLNVLSGFAHPLLSKESGHGSGNYGLLDQIAALKWVQKNITAFGGDPNNVTIWGESAGGLSVTALLVSPLTTGLFHKAIIESGAGNLLTTQDAAERAGEQLVKRMGLEGDPNPLTTLRSKPWKDFPDNTNYRGAPVLDGYAFTQHPRDAWAKGQQHNVPIIIGYNHDEETFFLDRDGVLPATIPDFQKSIRERFGTNAPLILELYPVKTDDDVYWAEIAMRTDQRFGVSARQMLRGWSTVSSKAWQYHFSYLPDASRDSKRGVPHAAELSYVFGNVAANADQLTRETSEEMVKYWTQFAKTGDPNQPGLPAWPSFAKGSESYLEIGRPVQAGKDLNKDRLDLLQSVPAAGDRAR